MKGNSFRDFWHQRGITDADIDGYTVPLDKDIHRAIEESGYWQSRLQEMIAAEEFSKGRLLVRDEVLGIADELLKEIGEWSP